MQVLVWDALSYEAARTVRRRFSTTPLRSFIANVTVYVTPLARRP